MPSVSHRGTRWFDICSVTTCAISCHSVASHWNSPGGRAFGESMRDHAAEAGAERADHARQPDGAHREVVVRGNISIEDRAPCGVNS